MATEQELKEIVKDRYSKIAKQEFTSSCCTPKTSLTSCCGSADKIDVDMIGDAYKSIKGHVDEADMSLGCGIPTKYAGIENGNTVLDLGSGAGNDVFVARQIVGSEGKVIGVDMTTEMVEKAEKIRAKLGYNNIEFHLGEIEALPVNNNIVDVVISNCVLNLVPNKKTAFAEIFRVLKNGGHFCISDIVLKGALPEPLKKSAPLYAGCVAGAVQLEEYMQIIAETGFKNVEIKSNKKIEIPENVLEKFLEKDELKKFIEEQIGLFSITVVGHK